MGNLSIGQVWVAATRRHHVEAVDGMVDQGFITLANPWTPGRFIPDLRGIQRTCTMAGRTGCIDDLFCIDSTASRCAALCHFYLGHRFDTFRDGSGISRLVGFAGEVLES